MMKAANELACYCIGSDGSDGCHVGFTAREYATGDNGPWLNGSVIEVVTVCMPDNENCSMHRLYHHNSGYAYAIVWTERIIQSLFKLVYQLK